MLLYMATTLGYVSTYSRITYSRYFFLLQYRGGIYRYRVLGTNAILVLSFLVHHLGLNLATMSVVSLPYSSSFDLFTSFVILNGISFVGFTLLMFAVTAINRQWVVPYIMIVTMGIASAYVVTPYDDLSYLLLAAVVIVGLAERPWSWPVCLILSVAGTANRESFFIGVAVLAAVMLARSTLPIGVRSPEAAFFRRNNSLAASTLAAVVGSVGSYLVVRIFYSEPTDHTSFWQPIPLKFNLNSSSLIAAIIVLLGAAVLVAELPAFADRTSIARSWYSRATIYLWLLSIPYLAVTFVGGTWFEAPRLIFPLAIAQYLLRWYADTQLDKNMCAVSNSPSMPSEYSK